MDFVKAANNAELIKKVKTRFLLIQSIDDDFVRYDDNGKIVFENAPEPKKLYTLDGAGHTGIITVMGETTYLKLISDWFLNN